MFEKSNNHYSWKKVTTTVHNIIVGKLWIDQVRNVSHMMAISVIVTLSIHHFWHRCTQHVLWTLGDFRLIPSIKKKKKNIQDLFK